MNQLCLCQHTVPVKASKAYPLCGQEMIEEANVCALSIADLCKALCNLWDLGHYIVLCMDANDDVRDSAVSAALAEI